MKKEYSKNWKSSKQPRKQRKYLANTPLHLKKKTIKVNLSQELRKKHSKRNIPVKKGDTVKVMKGKYKGNKGKILEIKLKEPKIIIEGIQTTKIDGSKASVKLQPSNLQIIEMNEEDKKRIKSEEKNKGENKK